MSKQNPGLTVYKNSTYYVTMHGQKSLFAGEKGTGPPGTPITYFYDGMW